MGGSLSVDRLIGSQLAGRHPEYGEFVAPVVAAFVQDERMGEISVGELMLVCRLPACGTLVIVPADGARTVLV